MQLITVPIFVMGTLRVSHFSNPQLASGEKLKAKGRGAYFM